MVHAAFRDVPLFGVFEHFHVTWGTLRPNSVQTSAFEVSIPFFFLAFCVLRLDQAQALDQGLLLLLECIPRNGTCCGLPCWVNGKSAFALAPSRILPIGFEPTCHMSLNLLAERPQNDLICGCPSMVQAVEHSHNMDPDKGHGGCP